MTKHYSIDETRDAYSWYMEERDRTLDATAQKFGIHKQTLLSRFRALGWERKVNYIHHYEDLLGKRFKRCIVIEKLPRIKRGSVQWKCLCDCGNEFEAYTANLLAGNTGGCGCGRNGTNNKGWNVDGRSVNKSSGYVFIRVKGHPRANRGGWVREHIVVMEKMLGRTLAEKEEVHHKNGIRHDNSEDNLELWNKSHPTGSRVEDLIEYSLNILRMYSPSSLNQNLKQKPNL